MPTIRAFTPADYPPVVALNNLVWPDEVQTVDEFRSNDEHRDPKCRWGRWVAELDGQVVGWAQHDQLAGRYHPGKYWLEFYVHPDHRRAGVGAALYNQVIAALLPYDPLLVRVALRNDMPDCIGFLTRRGFREDWHSWESRLDVVAFDPQPFVGVVERVQAQGIVFKTFRELDGDPDRDRKLFDLMAETRADAPMRDPATPLEFERWRETTIHGSHMDPDGYFVALAGDEYVGVSNLLAAREGLDVEVSWTGVRRAYRGRDIALALKLLGIDYARQQGYAYLRTMNNSLNAPMLAINAKLGYARLTAWLYYVQYLREEE